jgi:hypothetical protein
MRIRQRKECRDARTAPARLKSAAQLKKCSEMPDSAHDLEPIKLPPGVTAKDLLNTIPYNAKNPQQNQVALACFAPHCCFVLFECAGEYASLYVSVRQRHCPFSAPTCAAIDYFIGEERLHKAPLAAHLRTKSWLSDTVKASRVAQTAYFSKQILPCARWLTMPYVIEHMVTCRCILWLCGGCVYTFACMLVVLASNRRPSTVLQSTTNFSAVRSITDKMQSNA